MATAATQGLSRDALAEELLRGVGCAPSGRLPFVFFLFPRFITSAGFRGVYQGMPMEAKAGSTNF